MQRRVGVPLYDAGVARSVERHGGATAAEPPAKGPRPRRGAAVVRSVRIRGAEMRGHQAGYVVPLGALPATNTPVVVLACADEERRDGIGAALDPIAPGVAFVDQRPREVSPRPWRGAPPG